MTKAEYMRELSLRLKRLPKEDYDHAMEYFEEYFADAGAENEAQAIADLGTPHDAARELLSTLTGENAAQPPRNIKKGLSSLWIGILGVCAAPVTLPVLLVLLLVALMLVLVLFLCALCLFVAVLSVLLSGILSVIGGVLLLFHSFADGLATVGFGLIVLGGGTICTYGLFRLIRRLHSELLKLLHHITKGGKTS